jgi:hypothetical protein
MLFALFFLRRKICSLKTLDRILTIISGVRGHIVFSNNHQTSTMHSNVSTRQRVYSKIYTVPIHAKYSILTSAKRVAYNIVISVGMNEKDPGVCI